MELDFKTVKALSSPTRIKILNEALSGEPTPTELSEKVGKSKSTVSSHLDQLREAGLLEKDSEEGRRRVVYQPTSKTEAIIEGRSRKVKFSLTSSIVSAWVGAGLALGALKQPVYQKAAETGGSGGIGTMALNEGAEAARTAAETSIVSPENVFLFTGLGFLSIAVGSLVYGMVVSRVRE
ncbi:MAG: ArsR/SmtB family transcription factor, partial [Candidatus Nanohalobium sp.]